MACKSTRALEIWHIKVQGNLKYGTSKYRGSWSMAHQSTGALEVWHIKVQGHLKYGTSKYRGTWSMARQSIGALEVWHIKVQGHLKYGTSKYRGTWSMARQSTGALVTPCKSITCPALTKKIASQRRRRIFGTWFHQFSTVVVYLFCSRTYLTCQAIYITCSAQWPSKQAFFIYVSYMRVNVTLTCVCVSARKQF